MTHKPHEHTLPEEQTWVPLGYFSLYRLTLASLLLVLYFSGLGPSLLGKTDPGLYSVVSTAYFVLAVLGALLTRWRQPDFKYQVYLLLFIDIICITLMMHASGGIRSGLGILLVVSLASGSLLVKGRIAMLFASIASCAILTEQLYADLSNSFSTTAYTQGGLLGAAFFATAIVIQQLAIRTRESENLAAQRAHEITRLARLNEHIVQKMQSGIIAVGQDNRIELMNASAQTLLGIEQDILKQPLNQVAPDLYERLRLWRREPQQAVESFHPTDGITSIKPHFIALGTAGGPDTVIFLEDTAQLAQQAQQLTLAALGRLTASIAHEIRNPLSAISHAGQLLTESPGLDPADHRLTEIIHNHSNRINAIIEDVLQLSRRTPAQGSCIVFKPWLEHYLGDFCLNQSLTGEQLTSHITPDDLQVYMDANHLRQVLCNLIENALRYAVKPEPGQGAVQIVAGLLKDAKTPFIEVIDNGPGIPAINASHIFEPFFTSSTEGTGLGLYIARDLCEYNQARLEYFPHEPRGSRFRITFKPCNDDDAS